MLELNVQWHRGTFRLTAAGRFDAPVTGVIGRSGAGKSSLLNLIAGIERPIDGRIVLDGEVLFDRRERRFNVPAHRRRIATVFQDGRLFPHYTVEGNLRYGERRAGKFEILDIVIEACVDELVGALIIAAKRLLEHSGVLRFFGFVGLALGGLAFVAFLVDAGRRAEAERTECDDEG